MLVNKNRLFVIVSLAALAAYGTGWLLLPSLQGSRRAVDVQAAEQIERARRLLDKYNATLAFQSVLIDQLTSEGIEVAPEDLTDDVVQVRCIGTHKRQSFRENVRMTGRSFWLVGRIINEPAIQ
ncbi:MAG: hypothetical protein IH991_19670 [Planctomycetes bacterium]|nr:hypothetical protein [Planctomycetota bacterium]